MMSTCYRHVLKTGSTTHTLPPQGKQEVPVTTSLWSFIFTLVKVLRLKQSVANFYSSWYDGLWISHCVAFLIQKFLFRVELCAARTNPLAPYKMTKTNSILTPDTWAVKFPRRHHVSPTLLHTSPGAKTSTKTPNPVTNTKKVKLPYPRNVR